LFDRCCSTRQVVVTLTDGDETEELHRERYYA